MNWKRLMANLTPPILHGMGERLLRTKFEAPEWAYMPTGWSTENRTKGWDDPSIANTQEATWQAFSRSLEGTGPLGVSYESKTLTPQNLETHNTLMSYGYVLALASRKGGRLKILDWGGGAGQYYLVSKTLLSDVEIDYSCFDKRLLCELGRRVNPEVKFFENPDALASSYDLVLTSSSLQYFKNWSQVIKKLASITGRFLYVTRLPIVERAPSFVVVQRPYRYGYKTEYLGWFLNRQSLLKEIETNGFELIREFLISGMPFVKGAPEQAESRGFLFRPKCAGN